MNQKKYAVFTMDVESLSDTECISSSGIEVTVDPMDGLDEYISIMDRHGIKCTLFTVGDLAPKIADRLRRYLKSGHTLALHSYSHIPPLSVPLDVFCREMRRAKEQMESLFGVEIKGFRAPCFSIDKARLDALQEMGFRYDSSFLNYQAARHVTKVDLQAFEQVARNIFRRDSFYEFGLSTEKVFGRTFPVSGGGYVRLTKWSFIRSLLAHYIRQNDYYVFYLHPFELTKQRIPFWKELKNYDKYYMYAGIHTYGRRVERIIRMLKKHGYEFVTFDQLTAIMDSNS